MRHLCLALGLAATLVGTVSAPALADRAPWCAVLGREGSTECLYHSLEQCRATVSGIGGYCYQNQSDGSRARRERYRD